MDYQQPDNKNSSNFATEKRKFFRRMIITTLVVTGIFVAVVVIFLSSLKSKQAIIDLLNYRKIGSVTFNENKGNQSEKRLLEAENFNGSGAGLSYLRSVIDNSEMALSGAHEFGIRENYLYVTSIKDHGLEIMDISDQGNPKHVGAFFDNDQTFMKKPHSVIFKDNYAYVSATEDGAIQVFDISDPVSPQPISFVRDNEKMALKGVHAIAINGNYLYAAGTKDNGLEVIDISNPNSIKHVAAVFDNEETSLKGPHSIAFKDNYAYILTAEEGIEVMDISDPTDPRHVYSYTENDHGHDFGGGHDIIIRGSNLFTASYVDGLGFFDITNPIKIKLISEIHPSEENGLMSASDLVISGNNLFAISEVSGALIMVDISDTSQPAIKGIVRDDGSGKMFLWNGHYIETVGDYVYTAGLEDGFGVVKIKK